MRGRVVTLAALLAAALAVTPAAFAQSKKTVVGLSQPNVEHPYRVAGVNAARAWARQHPDVELIVADARRDSAKQLADVEDLLTRKIDVLLIAPNDANALVPIAARARAAGVPIVTFDRALNAPVAAHIGSDNLEMGRVAARFIAERIGNTGTVIQIEGTPGASATVDRKKGFEEVMGKLPKVKVVSFVGHYRRHDALQVMEDAITAHPRIAAVYAHNDEMAFGAAQALKARNKHEGVVIVGMDGGPTAVEAIESGTITGSVYYHHMFPEALELGMRVVSKQSVPEKTILPTPMITKENLGQFKK